MGKKKAALLSVALIAALLIVGCPGTVTFSMLMRNNTLLDAVELNVAPASAMSWGVNWLETTIKPTKTFNLKNLPPDVYDMRVAFDSKDKALIEVVVRDTPITNANIIWTLMQTSAGGEIYSTLQ
ncbi:MAG: hypothetical protein KJ052_09545 [Candidatus Hydrogenedentes bacterium]|nr:hypothetical protein [Candidatus Hydrogenedentota bacterium]